MDAPSAPFSASEHRRSPDRPPLGAMQGKMMAPASCLESLVESVAPEYQPLLVSLVERRAALRLEALTSEIPDQRISCRLQRCAEQKQAVARRIAAMFADAEVIEAEMQRDLVELDELEARELSLPLPFALISQVEDCRTSLSTLVRILHEETCEQGRQTLQSCIVLLEKTIELLKTSLSGSPLPVAS